MYAHRDTQLAQQYNILISCDVTTILMKSATNDNKSLYNINMRIQEFKILQYLSIL